MTMWLRGWEALVINLDIHKGPGQAGVTPDGQALELREGSDGHLSGFLGDVAPQSKVAELCEAGQVCHQCSPLLVLVQLAG